MRRATAIVSAGAAAACLALVPTACGNSKPVEMSVLLDAATSPPGSAAEGDAGATDSDSSATATPITTADRIAARPYRSTVPTTVATIPTGSTLPLVVLLHGYGSSGAVQADYFGLISLAERAGFLLAYPDGTPDTQGNRFWDATDACCNFYGPPVDDVAYVNAIIDDMSARYPVDPHRIYVVGHSNGGFMAHRAACDASSRIAAIVSLAGAVWNDPARCQPTSPVAVLEVHGDADATIPYVGGRVDPAVPPFPSAPQTVATWATKNGCTGERVDGDTLDLIENLPGEETQTSHFEGCQAAVELWTVRGGSHVPQLDPSWPAAIFDFLSAHPKP